MQALIAHDTQAWLGILGDDGTPAFDAALHDLVDVVPGWPRSSEWRTDGAGGPGFYAVAPVSLSRIAYQRLFTQAERIAIRASTNPIVVDFRELAALAETIDLDDADVVAGTQYLEALGLIAGGRAAAILIGQAPS